MWANLAQLITGINQDSLLLCQVFIFCPCEPSVIVHSVGTTQLKLSLHSIQTFIISDAEQLQQLLQLLIHSAAVLLSFR